MASDSENTTLDYGPVIADLESKKRFLEQTIAALKAVSAGALTVNVGSDLNALADSASGAIYNGDIPAGAFLGKSIPDAAKLYLSIVKRKQTSKEIAEALLKYGIETRSKNFNIQVHTLLDRARHRLGIVKLDGSYWGLAEWYPASLRSAVVPAAAKKSKKHRGSKRHRGAKPENAAAGIPASGTAKTSGGGVQEKVVLLLKSKPGTEFSGTEVAASVGLKPQVANLLLGKLVAANIAEKTASGKFRAAGAKLAASA